MPKMQDADNGCRLITHVKDKKRRQRHFPNSAPLVVERKALWHHGQTQRACARSLLPKRIAASELSSGTNSTISLRSAIALSAIRTLKSIEESWLLFPQSGAPGRLRHLLNRVSAPPPAPLHLARRSSRTIRQ